MATPLLVAAIPTRLGRLGHGASPVAAFLAFLLTGALTGALLVVLVGFLGWTDSCDGRACAEAGGQWDPPFCDGLPATPGSAPPLR